MKWNKRIVKTSILRIVVLMMIVGLNWSGISAIGQTLAYFNDTEISDNTSITVGSLNFSLSSDSDFSPLVTPSQSASRSIDVINEGSLDFQYQVSASDFSGDTEFCNALELIANLDGGDTEYTGNLTDFSYNTGEFFDPENWQFTASLPDDVSDTLENKTCSFKFIFEGVQLGECAGFSDIEEIENTITSGEWVIREEMKINKVYYDVDSEHGIEGDNEWVELYNPTDAPIDISNWKICDNTSCDTIPVLNSISGNGFAIITAQDTTWDYWNIPSGVEKIVLGDDIGNGLSDDGDRLILKNVSGYEIDAMSYGTDTYVFDPACPDVDEGHMLGRVPTGLDTDLASDFQDLAPPTVSVSYYSGTWYCGQTYTINWTAVNNNGDDNELLIDIVYITDNDRNGIISDSDNVYLVADDIANSGSYNLHICGDYCYYGYVWVKVIAYGPENFMVQASDTGPRVWEPPAPENELFDMSTMCPFELPVEEGTEEVEEPTDVDEEIFDDTIEEEDTIIDLPALDPVDTVTSVQDGVNIVDEEDIVEPDTGEVLNEEPVEEIPDEVIEDEAVVEEETTGEEITEEIPEDEPVDEPADADADADEEVPAVTDEEITEVVEEPEPIIESVEEEIVEEIIAVIEEPATVPEDIPIDDTEESPEADNDIQE